MQNKNKQVNNSDFPRPVDLIESSLDSRSFSAICKYLELGGDIESNPQLLSQEPYLLALAMSAKQDAKINLQNGENPRIVIFQRLATMTPLFVHAQSKLDDKSKLNDNEIKKYKSIASEYNSLLRDCMANYPNNKISDLNNFLLDSALYISAFDQDISKASIKINNTINPTIRGAQHEYCVEQQLQHLFNIGQIDSYRTASVDEDLKGIDLIAITKNGKEVLMDVKASLSEIEAQSRGPSAAAYHYDGRKTIVYSLAQDREFDGKLTLPHNLIETKSDYMLEIIDNISLLRKAR